MASTIFLRRSPRAFSVGLGLSSAFAAHAVLQSRLKGPLLCETATIGDQASSIFASYRNNAKTPVVTKDGRVNRSVYSQVSSGSIIGLIGGLAVSTFSKALTLLIGVFVAGTQYLEAKGLHVIPTGTIQKYFKNVDVRSAIEDNIAFKISFGLTFALAAFAQF